MAAYYCVRGTRGVKSPVDTLLGRECVLCRNHITLRTQDPACDNALLVNAIYETSTRRVIRKEE